MEIIKGHDILAFTNGPQEMYLAILWKCLSTDGSGHLGNCLVIIHYEMMIK